MLWRRPLNWTVQASRTSSLVRCLSLVQMAVQMAVRASDRAVRAFPRQTMRSRRICGQSHSQSHSVSQLSACPSPHASTLGRKMLVATVHCLHRCDPLCCAWFKPCALFVQRPCVCQLSCFVDCRLLLQDHEQAKPEPEDRTSRISSSTSRLLVLCFSLFLSVSLFLSLSLFLSRCSHHPNHPSHPNHP